MSELLVSIIIPVYNTENFVGRAIESAMNQSHEAIEIILVNDGSSDRSGEICEEYAAKDTRIRVLHQPNSGVSTARNRGLDIASGEYIQFMDSDDEIDSQMTDALLNSLRGANSDIAICGYADVGTVNERYSVEAKVYEGKDFLRVSYVRNDLARLVSSSCFMLFKKGIIDRNGLRFDESWKIGEDGLFTQSYLIQVSKVSTIDLVCYYHHIYDIQERFNTVAYFVADIYELRLEFFKRLFEHIEDDLNILQKRELFQAFFHQLIAGLVRFGACLDRYSKEEVRDRLTAVVQHPLVNRASKQYYVQRKMDSKLIPLFIKYRCPRLLATVIRNRGKRLLERFNGDVRIRSVYIGSAGKDS